MRQVVGRVGAQPINDLHRPTHNGMREVLIHKHLMGKIGQEELKRLARWLSKSPQNRCAFEKTVEGWLIAGLINCHEPADTLLELEKLLQRIALLEAAAVSGMV